GKLGDTNVGVQGSGVDDHTRVHEVVRVESFLELFEGTDDRGGAHAAEQFRPGLAVTVFAGQRTTVPDHDFSGFLHERPVFTAALFGGGLEVDTHVQATVTEVPVDHPEASVSLHESAEVTQVVTEVLGGNCCVLPPRPRLLAGEGALGEPGAFLPDAPEGSLVGGVGDHDRVLWAGRLRQCGEHLLPVGGGLFQVRPRDLHEQPGTTLGQGDAGLAAVPVQGRDDTLVDALDGQWIVSEQVRYRVGGRRGVRVAEDGQGTCRRGLHQPDRG